MPPAEPPVNPASEIVRIADLGLRTQQDFALRPDSAQRALIADFLSIRSVRKLRFDGRLVAEGTRDWRLEAMLGATVVQDCVVTLDPVTTRIDESVVRRYVSDLPDPEPGEVEMPEDDSVEPLPREVDLAAVMIEALSLALPPFPRTDGVELGEVAVTEPGVAPLRDGDLKPFAGLADLKKAIEDDNMD